MLFRSGALRLHVLHPGRPQLDQSVLLPPPGAERAVFQAPLVLSGAGLRHIVLEDTARTWRLAGELRLRAGAMLATR